MKDNIDEFIENWVGYRKGFSTLEDTAFTEARTALETLLLQEITELVGEDDTIATIPADGFAQYEEEYRKAYAQQRYEILTKAKERYE